MAERWDFLDHPSPIPFAHRGGGAEHPENTMVAFAAAVALGYRYLETDVRASADGTLLAFHDRALDRISDGRGRLSRLPYSELRTVGVAGEPIPLLAEVLSSWPEARLSIDVKHDGAVEPLLHTLERTAAHHRVCVGAFSDRRLARIRALSASRVRTSTGLVDLARLRMASLGGPAAGARAACVKTAVGYGRLCIVDERFVRTAHEGGVPVHVYTVDERSEMERLLELGVDGIMTDRPSVLKDVLVERGHWT